MSFEPQNQNRCGICQKPVFISPGQSNFTLCPECDQKEQEKRDIRLRQKAIEQSSKKERR